MSTNVGTWIDADVTAPPKDQSFYLLMAWADDPGEDDGQLSATGIRSKDGG
jgi:hypothetical protein